MILLAYESCWIVLTVYQSLFYTYRKLDGAVVEWNCDSIMSRVMQLKKQI